MGGKGSGGARANSGPKRRDPSASWLAGGKARGPRGVVPSKKDAALAEGGVERPRGMDPEIAAVWEEFAPIAKAQQTLTAGSVAAFAWWCRTVMLERKLAAAPLTAAGPDHRGMMTRVEAGLTRFRLWPDGRPVAAEPEKDEWSEFDGPTLVKRA